MLQRFQDMRMVIFPTAKAPVVPLPYPPYVYRNSPRLLKKITLELVFVYHIAASGASSLLWLCNGTDYVPAVYLTTLRSFFKELHTYVRMWTTKYHAQTGILVSFSYIQHISSVFEMFPGVPLRAPQNWSCYCISITALAALIFIQNWSCYCITCGCDLYMIYICRVSHLSALWTLILFFWGGSYCSGGFLKKKTQHTGLGLSAIAFQSLRITFVT